MPPERRLRAAAEEKELDRQLERYHGRAGPKERGRDRDKDSGGGSLAKELAALGALRRQGVLSEEEFVAAKKAEIARRQG